MKNYFLLITLFLSPILSWSQVNIALVGSNSEISSLKNNNSSDKFFEANFEWLDRMILVEAELNGQKGKYILDTGSPLLMINQKPKSGASKVNGISKSCQAEIIEVKEFNWAGISNKRIEAVAMDLSGLEESLGASINGLIGKNVFGSYELFFDVSNKVIQLHKAKRSKLHKENKYKEKVSFQLQGHIPVIVLKIDGKKYRFGIDSGAEVNVLDKELKEKLIGQLSNFSGNEISGVEGISEKVESAILNEFKLKGNTYSNFEFLFLDLKSFEKEFDMHLDGILGYPFLAYNKISINYFKQKIYIW